MTSFYYYLHSIYGDVIDKLLRLVAGIKLQIFVLPHPLKCHRLIYHVFYLAVTGKPLISGIKQYTGDVKAYRSGSDAGSSIASDHIKFTRSHSGSPGSKVPPGGNKRRHRNPINGLSTSPAPPHYSDRDISAQGLLSAKTTSEGIPMRKCESVPVRKDAASALTKSKSPDCVNSSAQSESGESSIVGTLV